MVVAVDTRTITTMPNEDVSISPEITPKVNAGTGIIRVPEDDLVGPEFGCGPDQDRNEITGNREREYGTEENGAPHYVILPEADLQRAGEPFF